MYTEFQTEDLPAPDRFEAWYDLTLRSFVPSILSGNTDTDFRASTKILTLGGVQVSAVAAPTLQIHRPTRLIRRSDPEHLMMWLHLSGTFALSTAGRDATPGPRELLVYDTSRPYHGLMMAGSRPFRGIVVQAPRALLSLPSGDTSQFLGQCLPGRVGMGAILTRHLAGLLAHASQCRPIDAARLSSVTLELLTTFLDGCRGDGPIAPENYAQALQVRIHDFVEQHLDRPDLSPATIATAHRISIRYLHKLFEDQGHTVAAWVRERRLERCRRDLADPRLRSRSVQSIATQWGFSNAAHFSRLFRTAYAMSPRDYRKLGAQIGNDCAQAAKKPRERMGMLDVV